MHPKYRPGREHYDFNALHGTFPRVWYTREKSGVEAFVRKYSTSRLACYSLNPRPQAFRNSNGYNRSAREEEAELSMNAVFDFDLQGDVSDSRTRAFEDWLTTTADYFNDQGLNPPVRAFTGRGCHLLFGYFGLRLQHRQATSETWLYRRGRASDRSLIAALWGSSRKGTRLRPEDHRKCIDEVGVEHRVGT